MVSIYTKTGDRGETSLFGGGRVDKDDARVDAYGEVDELNAVLGLACTHSLHGMETLVRTLQEELFTVGSVLATPKDTKAYHHIPTIDLAWISAMEKQIDAFDIELVPLATFILPGGTPSAAVLHMARTVCRRAERKLLPLLRQEKIDSVVITYLNRLSDLLFTMARVANARAQVKDVLWLPKAKQ